LTNINIYEIIRETSERGKEKRKGDINMAGAEKEKDEVTYDVIEHVGVIATYPNGWTKELNIVAWNGGTGKYDLRDWDATHEHMSRGITLHKDEAKKLCELLQEQEM